jgi:hypothetical protein
MQQVSEAVMQWVRERERGLKFNDKPTKKIRVIIAAASYPYGSIKNFARSQLNRKFLFKQSS